MSHILLVPIRIDALFLPTAKTVHAPVADFSRLPYQNKQGDHNSNSPFLSGEVENKAFQGQSLLLKAGIHLHWVLPDALTRGRHTEGVTQFPAIPNRWLIKRKESGKKENYWVVESDYLFPELDSTPGKAISYPYEPDSQKQESQPFRQMGRSLPLSAWEKTNTKDEYLGTLTALGYGDPSFAAFYPNCFSVLGFHDEYPDQDKLANVKYEILGWYQDSGQDPIRDALQRALKLGQDLNTVLKERFHWKPNASLSSPQKATVFYSKLTFSPTKQAFLSTLEEEAAKTELALGDTGTEALSALLAKKINPPQAAIIEDQLEALHLGKGLEKQHLDLGAKFQEARHSKAFNASGGGTVWRINLESKATKADADTSHKREQITLPANLADLLNKLNLRQHELDRKLEVLGSLKQQLFSDWNKYMLCQYPPTDQMLDYPDVEEVKQFVAGGIQEIKDLTASLTNLRRRKEEVHLELEKALGVYQAEAKKLEGKYVLQGHVGHFFWQPKDPCVLLRGPLLKSGLRHLQGGMLECFVLEGLSLQSFDQTEFDSIFANAPNAPIAINDWESQPWHPLFMEWEVEAFPLSFQNSLSSHSGDYSADFIKSNYALQLNQPDFSLKGQNIRLVRNAQVYAGRSLMSPHAGPRLKMEIEKYLARFIFNLHKEAFFKVHPPSKGKEALTFLENKPLKIISWLTEAGKNRVLAGSSLDHIIKAYQEILTQKGILSQTMGDFHRSLLMHRQGLNLPVKDPLGFKEDQLFTEEVRKTLGKGFFNLPRPHDVFQPLRNGALKLNQLRLIDTFGQSVDIPTDNLFFPERLRIPGNTALMALPPRLAQEARVRFQWLSANHDRLEMNSHPATSPICGWIIPNNLDQSLMIYDAQGMALGIVNQLAQWKSFPGTAEDSSWLTIENVHLKQMIGYLINRGETFLSQFIASLDSAQEQIDPESFAHHLDLALLMGRPIALVRAELGFELKGNPAVDQGWDMLLLDMQRKQRETRAFEQVKLPVRIGEYKQLNDGLIGFWLEEKGLYADNTFYAPQSTASSHEKIKTHADGSALLYQSIGEAPKQLSLLLDPKAKLHITTGILPTQVLEIPPDQYAAALQKMEISFRAMPILTDQAEFHLTLPTEPGYHWSWLGKPNQQSWQEIEEKASIQQSLFLDKLQDIPEVLILWNYLLEPKVKWLEPVPHDTTRAYVVSKDQRVLTTLPDKHKPYETRIQAFFDLYAPVIQPMNTQVSFDTKQGLREGWLKLRKT